LPGAKGGSNLMIIRKSRPEDADAMLALFDAIAERLGV
jgi:hypothetical protein